MKKAKEPINNLKQRFLFFPLKHIKTSINAVINELVKIAFLLKENTANK